MSIYFIQNETTGLVKIGHSSDPLRRFAVLQTGSPDRLRLRRILEGTRLAEWELHRRFTEQHVRREWFALSEAQITASLEFADLPIPSPTTAPERGISGKPKALGWVDIARPDVGDRALTVAERQARHRARVSGAMQAAKSALEAVIAAETIEEAREIAAAFCKKSLHP